MNVATELESPQGKGAATGHMKELVYHGPGHRRCRSDRPRRPADSAVLFAAAVLMIDLDDNRLRVARNVRRNHRDQQRGMARPSTGCWS